MWLFIRRCYGGQAMEMPSQEEQIIAEKYVLDRPLERPDTDVKKAVKSVLLYIFCTFAVALILRFLFEWLDISSFLPEEFFKWTTNNKALFNIMFFITIYFICGMCCLRTATIGIIKLYQHYAPEDIRRRCLFKPTCSEYAILAIKKYGLTIGLIKSYIRLFKKCRGNIYRIDYP